MPRMYDVSSLEGDDLENWYRRSPADIEAEREAARQAKYDAFVKSIGDAFGSQRRSTDTTSDPEGGYESENVHAGEDGAGIIRTRYYRPTAPMVVAPPAMAPPSGPQVGPSVDAQGGPALGPNRSGFFGTHDYSPALGGYFTDLPAPLNTVTPKANPNWWELGDGGLASTDEVERIYAEQQRRLRGQEDVEPAPSIRSVDKLKDGYVPRVDQVGKGERELDPTCSPYGGWERDPGYAGYSPATQAYERQITRAPGLDYVVRAPGQKPVKFDGCAVWDPRHPLLEAKGPGYSALLAKATQWGFFNDMQSKAGTKLSGRRERQVTSRSNGISPNRQLCPSSGR